jgi:hypothetical protein
MSRLLLLAATILVLGVPTRSAFAQSLKDLELQPGTEEYQSKFNMSSLDFAIRFDLPACRSLKKNDRDDVYSYLSNSYRPLSPTTAPAPKISVSPRLRTCFDSVYSYVFKGGVSAPGFCQTKDVGLEIKCNNLDKAMHRAYDDWNKQEAAAKPQILPSSFIAY